MQELAEPVANAVLDVSDARQFLSGHPHEIYDALRRDDPVHFVEHPLGGEPHWLLTRHTDIRAVSMDSANWTSARGFRLFEAGRAAALAPDVLQAVRQNMLLVDPPLHSTYRRPLVASFTARALSAIEQAVAEAVEELLLGFADRDEIEFVSEFAGIIPIKALCRVLGIPAHDEQAIFDWTNTMVGVSDPEYHRSVDEASQVHRDVFAYGRELLRQRRSGNGNDVLSVIARMEIDGRPFLGPDLDGMIALLMAAGNETTRNSLTGAMIAFSRFHHERQRLLDDPSLTNSAVEELLRYVSPVIQMARTARDDILVGGRKIAAGDKVVLLYGAANHDPDLFDDPHQLRLGRPNAREHLAFGIGVHHCLGAHMARLQIRIVLQLLLRHYPKFQLASEPQYLQSNFVCSVKRAQVALRQA